MTEAAALEIHLDNRLEEIRRLAERIDGYCEDHALPTQVGFHLNLALDEILTNVIQYAYEDAERHTILVRLALEDGAVSAEVVDDGRPYDPTAAADPDTSLEIEDRPIGGLGIFFVKRVMDRLDYVRDGPFNRLRMVRRLDRTEAQAS
jgi:anti-sigma regulatory factor (Ser/Thr protein kinase)